MIFKIAITGGTSSGKSFVSKIFSEQLNCITFDTDKIVSKIYKDINFCKLHFQSDEKFLQLLNKNKVVCKRKLKKAILDNNLILDEICKIVYPELKNQIFKIFEQFKNDKYIIFEIPMLFESSFDVFFDFIINISSDKNTQLKRSIDKKISKTLHELFISKQLCNSLKNQKAHFIIINNDNIKEQISECINTIKNFNNNALR
jgi:dephospho-CoA kinase